MAAEEERPLVLLCKGQELAGILHPAEGDGARKGVLLVVGGPQYRAGSHRQFVHLARHLAASGVPVLRFDYRGMGDSQGELRDFQTVEADIAAAADRFVAECPGLRELVLWGLCDAASAAAFYAFQDERVTGVVLANPWVRTQSGEARAQLKHYYRSRLSDPAFWRKVVSLRFNPIRSAREVLGKAVIVLGGSYHQADAGDWRRLPLPERMRYGLSRFQGRCLVLLSGNDLTAREFEDTVAASPEWQRWIRDTSVTTCRLQEADHTFSRRRWRDQVAWWTTEWLSSW